MTAEGWDVDLLVILMNIIHGHHGSVPRSISLETLAKVAVLVDYYQCHEIVEVLSGQWVENLRPDIPTEYSTDLILWLFVSWVFSVPDLFKFMTKIAVRESCDLLYAPSLPIPKDITGKCIGGEPV